MADNIAYLVSRLDDTQRAIILAASTKPKRYLTIRKHAQIEGPFHIQSVHDFVTHAPDYRRGYILTDLGRQVQSHLLKRT